MASVSRRKPPARAGHVAVSVGKNMLVWAGDGKRVRTSSVERFDVASASWLDPRVLSGQSLPEGLHDMADAQDGDRAYMFGGKTDTKSQRKRYNDVYEIDLNTYHCWKHVPATDSALVPLARSGVVAWFVLEGNWWYTEELLLLDDQMIRNYICFAWMEVSIFIVYISTPYIINSVNTRVPRFGTRNC